MIRNSGSRQFHFLQYSSEKKMLLEFLTFSKNVYVTPFKIHFLRKEILRTIHLKLMKNCITSPDLVKTKL